MERREKVEETFRLLIEGICSKANMQKKQQIENASKENKWKLSIKQHVLRSNKNYISLWAQSINPVTEKKMQVGQTR